MATNPRLIADFELRRLLFEHGDVVAAGHQWLCEHDRWVELVFALFVATSDIDEMHLRTLVRSLDALRLLDIAEIPGSENPEDVFGWIKRCNELVDGDADIPAASIDRALRAVSDIASVLRTKYRGRIQRMLRAHAERVLSEISDELKESGINAKERGHALTYWLQNVLSLPLPLQDESTKAFVHANGITEEDLIDAADELDINVALIDDLVYHDFLMRSKAGSAAECDVQKV